MADVDEKSISMKQLHSIPIFDPTAQHIEQAFKKLRNGDCKRPWTSQENKLIILVERFLCIDDEYGRGLRPEDTDGGL